MSTFVVLSLFVALLFPSFRRSLLILPISLAGFVGGYLAWEALWKATGGQYGECTDICFEPHISGTASSSFTPLWIFTVVAIASIVVGLSVVLLRSSLAMQKRKLAHLGCAILRHFDCSGR